MEFDSTRTAVAIAVLYGLAGVAVMTSSIPDSAASLVLGILIVYGGLMLVIGVKYGAFLTTRESPGE